MLFPSNPDSSLSSPDAQKCVRLLGLTDGSSGVIASPPLSAQCSWAHWAWSPGLSWPRAQVQPLCVALGIAYLGALRMTFLWAWHMGLWFLGWALNLTWYSRLSVQSWYLSWWGSNAALMATRIANLIQCVRSLYRTRLCQSMGPWASFTVHFTLSPIKCPSLAYSEEKYWVSAWLAWRMLSFIFGVLFAEGPAVRALCREMMGQQQGVSTTKGTPAPSTVALREPSSRA